MAKKLSRTKRYEAAIETISGARADIEELKEELENWLDNMPENLQQSAKADELQDAIGELEDVLQSIDEAESADIQFPGMR